MDVSPVIGHMKTYTFKKEERLCSKRLIANLFHNGSSFIVYPYRVVYSIDPSLPNTQVMISVAKKRLRHSTDRNLIKRCIRECYRQQKQELLYDYLSIKGLKITFSIQYLGDLEISFETLYTRMGEMLKKLQHECDKKSLES